MMCALFASDALRQLGSCPVPSRCPYCPREARRHWIRWGRYERYAGDREDTSRKVAVPRYWCKIAERTFSLLPDGLLPYCSVRTALVLEWLHALYVDDTPVTSLARKVDVARSTLRGLRARFVHTVPHLRLRQRQAALAPAAFLKALVQRPPVAVVARFRRWKEGEPKHSIVGIHPR